MGGAEKLLGNGDMLFLSGETSHPKRIQGVYLSEKEVKDVVNFIKEEKTPEYAKEIIVPSLDKKNDLKGIVADDPLYEEAKELVVRAEKASASYLQRRLRIGYARAARILDMLEENKIIGPANGAKPREILISSNSEDSQDQFQSLEEDKFND